MRVCTAATTGSGSQPACDGAGLTDDASPVARASRSSNVGTVGRPPGSLARHSATKARKSGGSRRRSGSSWTTRKLRACAEPVPNGPAPVAVKARTAPREKTSLAGPTGSPVSCSGDMNPGVPTATPVRVSALASPVTEIPKSITRGPSEASRMFDGLRSRWITSAAWIASSASASPAPSASTEPSGQGPCAATASPNGTPGTYAVASHAGEPSGSASTTPAVNTPFTRRAAATSRANRRRKSPSSASSGRTTLTATARPPGERPR
jgi:hypothetical protein